MQRDILDELKAWKKRSDRKPLLVLGARQVGKTWIMKEFGRTEYQNVAYINCDEEPLAQQLFLSDYNIDRILLTLQAITGEKIVPEETLIILDELQEAPRGLHCLKYFQEKAPQYHVVSAGSLLGITLNRAESFPVGKVDMIKMYPMSFSEFVRASGQDQLAEILLTEWATIDILSSKYIDLLRQYYFVGGMPEVVSSFFLNKDLEEVRRKQAEILDAYRRDISKHTSKAESVRIGQVLNSLPSQLAKENKKFIYGMLRSGARAADYELAIQWLIDAGIVHKVSRVRELRQPLKFYEDLSAFKLFLLDCGLLGCMADAKAVQMLVGDSAFVEFKGAFTEQFVLQQLVSSHIVPYYWSNDKTPAEIDFVIETDTHVVPVEVKAGTNVRSRSLSTFVTSHPELNLRPVRLSMLPYKNQGWMENVPLYGITHFIQS